MLLAGSAQKANVWSRRMEILASWGYECHALDFVQTGCYLTRYSEQMQRLRWYIERKCQGQPILIGHSQGGTKAQLYLTAADGDAAIDDEDSRVRACVLMASPEQSFVGAAYDIAATFIRHAGILRAIAAGLLGCFYLDPICFCFGGGPWRHRLALYRSLFNTHTEATTLATVQTLRDARAGVVPDAASDDAGVPISSWADACLSCHDPLPADLGVVAQARSPGEALASTGCAMLHLVAADDRVVPRSQSDKVAAMWATPATVIQSQAHQMGDKGWERSVMEPLREFLVGLE